MSETPVTQYAQAADGVHLAYQVSGEGALSLVFAAGSVFAIDLMWDDPGVVHVARRLGTFSRTVWFEGRGMGSSEGTYVDNTVGETFDADLTAVLDAAGCEQVALLASSDPGPSAVHFAVTHPDRVSALVLFNTWAQHQPNRCCRGRVGLRFVQCPTGSAPHRSVTPGIL